MIWIMLLAEVVRKLHTHTLICAFIQNIYLWSTKFKYACCEEESVYFIWILHSLLMRQKSFYNVYSMQFKMWSTLNNTKVLSITFFALLTISLYCPSHIHNRNEPMFIHLDSHMLINTFWAGRSMLSIYDYVFVWAAIWYLGNRGYTMF